MARVYPTQDVAIRKLRNDPLNPRHPELGSQLDIIEWTMQQYGREIYNLAKDVLEFGLSPIERILAIRSDSEKGCFIVVEGNRRLTALRLLDNPALCPVPEWRRKFEQLAQTRRATIPKTINVTVAPNRDAVRWILERRHRGEDQGRGLKRWNAQQAARAERLRHSQATRYDRAINVVDYATENDLLGPETSKLKDTKFPITTLERLLADAVFVNSLGISFSNRELYLTTDTEEANRALARVLSDLAGGLSVTKVKNAKLRQKYLTRIRTDLPGANARLGSSIPAKKAPQTTTGLATSSSTSSGGTRSLGHPDKRKHLIMNSIKVSEHNIRRAYTELKGIDLNEFSQAAACLLRVFLEWSLDHYLENVSLKVPVKGRDQRASLRARMKAVGEHLNAKGIIPTAHKKAVIAACNSNGGIADPDNLHMPLHSRYHFARKKDLIQIWDSVYEPLLTALWADMRTS